MTYSVADVAGSPMRSGGCCNPQQVAASGPDLLSPQMLSLQGVALVVTGPGGGGKSSTVEFLYDEFGIPVVRKVGDSVPRHDQTVIGPGDTIPVSREELDRLVEFPDTLWYPYGVVRKLFFVNEMRELLAAQGIVSLVSGHRNIAAQLKVRLPRVDIIQVYVDTKPEIIAHRLRAAGYTEEQISFRMHRSHQNEEHYRDDPGLYHVIDNNRDETWLHAQLREVARHYLRLLDGSGTGAVGMERSPVGGRFANPFSPRAGLFPMSEDADAVANIIRCLSPTPEEACEDALRSALLKYLRPARTVAMMRGEYPRLRTIQYLEAACKQESVSPWRPTAVDWPLVERAFAVLERRAARLPDEERAIAQRIATELHDALLLLPPSALETPSRHEFGKSVKRIFRPRPMPSRRNISIQVRERISSVLQEHHNEHSLND